jgi:hypothetical protein
MQVTFIKPTPGRMDGGDRFVDEGRMEPLSLGVLAGLTPSSTAPRIAPSGKNPAPRHIYISRRRSG